MRSVMLEQLYDGNVGPAHMTPYETERGKYYTEKAKKLEAELEKQLDDQGRKLLRKLQEARNAAYTDSSHGDFIHGFKMATMIMTEVFVDRESEMRRAEFYWRSRFPELVDSENS
jgi:hypothetical protein